MSIVNGYCTLDQLRQRLLDAVTYTASTISFTAATKKISDTAGGLARFLAGEKIRVIGSAGNDRIFTVVTGGNADEIVVAETVVDEVAGSSVTISDVTVLENDAVMEEVIAGISRLIDKKVGRRYYAVTETRYYTAESETELRVDPLLSVSSLDVDYDGDRVYEVAFAATDYDLYPYNAAVDGSAYRQILIAPLGRYRFPAGMPRGISVTGSFGETASIPAIVREACLLMAERLYKRKDAPFGVTGAPGVNEMIAIAAEDPDFKTLLKPLIDDAREWIS